MGGGLNQLYASGSIPIVSGQAAIGLDIKLGMGSTPRNTTSEHLNMLGGDRIDGATIIECLVDGCTNYRAFCFRSV